MLIVIECPVLKVYIIRIKPSNISIHVMFIIHEVEFVCEQVTFITTTPHINSQHIQKCLEYGTIIITMKTPSIPPHNILQHPSSGIEENVVHKAVQLHRMY